MEAKFLLLETSGAVGRVGLGLGSRVLAQQTLDLQHRHNRDLAPVVAGLLRDAGWRARELNSVIVSRGPGSYTGLRVGIMSAKTLAYATGCGLVAVETFACLARQAPEDVKSLEVIADAQQGNIYTQAFARNGPTGAWQPAAGLSVEAFAVWLGRRRESTWVTGPGLLRFAEQIGRSEKTLPSELWLPKLESLLETATEQGPCAAADLLTLEPLYLRPSSAEQKWDVLGKGL